MIRSNYVRRAFDRAGVLLGTVSTYILRTLADTAQKHLPATSLGSTELGHSAAFEDPAGGLLNDCLEDSF